MKYRKLICKNDLIDMIKKYKPIELRVFYNMLYCAKEQRNFSVDFKDEEIVYMNLNKLNSYIGKKHFTEEELFKIIQGIPKGVFSKNGLNYISVFDFITCNEEGEIEFRLNSSFRPMIDDVIKNFTVLELKDLSTLNSIYSQRLFEFTSKNNNLIHYLMPINDFRTYFQVPKSYSMCNIDQRIIEPMLKEINEKTDFTVSIRKIKKRNRVTHIKFTFKGVAK